MEKREIIPTNKEEKTNPVLSDWDVYKTHFIEGVLKGFTFIETIDKKYAELKNTLKKLY